MKILLIGKKTSHLALRLVEEAKKAKQSLVAVEPGELQIIVSTKGFKAKLANGKNILDFDVFYFYAIGKDSLAGGRLPLDKFDWRQQDILATPDYQFFFDFKKRDYNSIKYPTIVKDIHSSRGAGVFKVTNKTELKKVIDRIGTKIIIQKYLPVKSDYRVLVVGNEALGAIERVKSQENVASNRKPEKVLAVTVPDSALQACVAASRAKGLAIAGVDLLSYRGKYYVWEINASPQCRIFEKYTGVNAPAKILQYLQSLVKTKA
jgi:hypothetical protein